MKTNKQNENTTGANNNPVESNWDRWQKAIVRLTHNYDPKKWTDRQYHIAILDELARVHDTEQTVASDFMAAIWPHYMHSVTGFELQTICGFIAA